jgi:undecaprenyl diphosphate synthase
MQAALKMADMIVSDPDRRAEIESRGIAAFDEFLITAGIPDPDLIIRTSGEQRISNYLLWQSAYSELYFTDILWPDFRKHEFRDALEEYGKRDRRYGKVK